MRPTGRLHLGHLVGALDNWVKLQDQYECFYCIVDWHALTTNYESTDDIRANILDNAMDWLAAGLDPNRATIFVQSRVVEHAELHLLLSMIDAARLAGTRADLQRTDDRADGEGSAHLWIPGLSAASVRGHPCI